MNQLEYAIKELEKSYAGSVLPKVDKIIEVKKTQEQQDDERAQAEAEAEANIWAIFDHKHPAWKESQSFFLYVSILEISWDQVLSILILYFPKLDTYVRERKKKREEMTGFAVILTFFPLCMDYLYSNYIERKYIV